MAPAQSNILKTAESIAKEFSYEAEDVRRSVKEFLRLMGEQIRRATQLRGCDSR